MKRVVISNIETGSKMSSCQLQMGECMIVDDADIEEFKGTVIMYCHNGYVDLHNPDNTWDKDVRIVGYKITSFAMQYYLEQTK